MKKITIKETKLCDHCGQIIEGNSHSFIGIEGHYDLHAVCMQSLVADTLDSRPSLPEPEIQIPGSMALLDKDERNLVVACLDYAWHRVTQHGKLSLMRIH